MEARIASAKRLEQRIAHVLENLSGDVQAIVQVERELARARGELEQLEGRRRLLANRTAYSTITLHVSERTTFVPPRAPTFGERLAQAWTDSVSEWLGVGENLVVTMVAMIPWGGNDRGDVLTGGLGLATPSSFGKSLRVAGATNLSPTSRWNRSANIEGTDSRALKENRWFELEASRPDDGGGSSEFRSTVAKVVVPSNSSAEGQTQVVERDKRFRRGGTQRG